MEQTGNRVSWLSLLTDARQELRTYLALETRLIECASKLPGYASDDCDTQVSFQLGAGWAYRQPSNAELDHEAIYNAFFATKPNRWNLSEEYLAWERQHVIAVAQLMLAGEDLDFYQLDMRIEVPKAQELIAFIQGATITSDFFASQDRTSPTPATEPA